MKHEVVVLRFPCVETNCEPYETFKVGFFAKIVNGWKLLTISSKSSVLEVWEILEYVLMLTQVICRTKNNDLCRAN